MAHKIQHFTVPVYRPNGTVSVTYDPEIKWRHMPVKDRVNLVKNLGMDGRIGSRNWESLKKDGLVEVISQGVKKLDLEDDMDLLWRSGNRKISDRSYGEDELALQQGSGLLKDLIIEGNCFWTPLRGGVIKITNGNSDNYFLIKATTKLKEVKKFLSRPFTKRPGCDIIKLDSKEGLVKGGVKEVAEVKGKKGGQDNVTEMSDRQLAKKLTQIKSNAERTTVGKVNEAPDVKKSTSKVKEERKMAKATAVRETKKTKKGNDNLVVLKDLAEELGKDPKEVRRVLRSKIEREEGGSWSWTKGSAELKEVRILLGLDTPGGRKKPASKTQTKEPAPATKAKGKKKPAKEAEEDGEEAEEDGEEE